MEEETKEMKKLIRIYNHFIFFEPLRGLLLFFIAVANITVAILAARTGNGILWLFLAVFLCDLMILFYYAFWNWNYNILFLGKVGIVQHYFEMNKKYFSKKDMKKIYLKEFLEKEGLEGLPLDSEDVMNFLKWQKNGIERL